MSWNLGFSGIQKCTLQKDISSSIIHFYSRKKNLSNSQSLFTNQCIYNCVFIIVYFSSRNTQLCDVTLVSHGIELYAHKVMLSSGSSYFFKMFTESEVQENRVSLEEVSGEALRSTVEYIYFEKEIHICEDNALVCSYILFNV